VEEDLRLSRKRQEQDALDSYARQRADLGEHLGLVGAEVDRAIRGWGAAAAAAATEAAKSITSAWASEITRYQQYLPYSPTSPEIDRYRQYQEERPPIVRSKLSNGVYVPQYPTIQMASGGIVEASSPTHILMGESGPETGVFLPGGGRSLNVQHNFGKVDVGFGGLPAGVNTQQIQNIAVQVFTQLFKSVQIPVR